MIRKSRYFFQLWFVLVACLSMGQSATPRIFKAVRSPEVDANRRVTYRFFAPRASKVTVSQEESKPLSMTKDDKGIWSVTTEPLAPDIYSYYFLVDGVQYADPANTNRKAIVTGGNENLVHVSGSETLDWEESNVPHGIVHRHRYRSSVLNEHSGFLVYTPPGYNPSQKKTYPVLYLLHGVLEDETAWLDAGKVDVIIDNLLAQKRAKPMIVVMPLSYGFGDVPNRVGDVLMGKADHRRDFDQFSKTLLKEILPEVEKNYRVGKARSIAGVSMGGAEALYLGLNHPEAFSDVASFSGAFIMFGPKFDSWFPHLSGKLPAVTLTCGTEDFLSASNAGMRKWLTEQKVSLNATDTPGGHSWPVWRRNLIEYVSRLFV